MGNSYTGYTSNTPDRLLLDAGAFFKNFIVGTDTPESAAAKLLGATRGGGQFDAKPKLRAVKADGVRENTKGLKRIEGWDITIEANMLEITAEMLKSALITGDLDTASNSQYDIISARNDIALADYINNITWIGNLSGSSQPVIIQIYNALGDGLSLKTEDNNEAVTKAIFTGHSDAADLQSAPFKIYYPKMSGDTTPPTFTVSPANNATAVAVGASVVWTFNEVIQAACVNSANFFVMKQTDGSVVPGTLTLDSTKKIVTYKSTGNLTAATVHLAVATTNVRDVAGNALATNSVTKFTTA